jgi:subtilisin family serine protease
MKVTVKKYLNVRVGKASLNAPCYQYLAPGSELEVDGNLYKGDTYEGVDTWLKDAAGNYYWSGGIEKIINLIDQPLGNLKQSYQWFKDLGIEQIWSKYNEYGDNAMVAILDTGYDINNSDLPVPFLSKVFVKDNSNPITIQDKVGHGTYCVSLIADNNKNFNIGIAPQSKTLIGKVSHVGEFPDFNLILDAIDWAIKAGADIISISLGLPLDNQTKIEGLQSTFNQIVQNKNVLIFASSGNSMSGQIISKEFYPASFENCASVGTVQNNKLHNITVRSNKTILHTLGIDVEGYVLNNIIAKQSGTSISTPIIAGLMALAVSFVKKKNNGQWNSNELLDKLILTGDPLETFPNKKEVNILKFFQSL